MRLALALALVFVGCSSSDSGGGPKPGADAGPSADPPGASGDGGTRVDFDGGREPVVDAGPDATTTPPGWPGPTNTGVPAGTVLAKYTGKCDLRTDNEVIEGKSFACGLLVYAKNVTIRKSKIVGIIKTNAADASLTLEDVEVDGGDDHSEAVGGDHVTVLRGNIHGDQHAIHCDSHCVVKDSWMHDQFDGNALGWHQNGFISNGGTDFTIEHNTVGCKGGCTADISFINDDDISNGLVENNLLLASPDSPFCAYPFGSSTSGKPGKVTNMTWKNNVFQRGANDKCATYGPVYEYSTKDGNTWTNNTWEDGTPITDD